MDELYFEEGYYEGKYFVYTASALVGLGPYIASGYLDQDFFEDRGASFTLVGELTEYIFTDFSATLTATFTVTVVASNVIFAASDTAVVSVLTVSVAVDRRTSVTLSTIADLAAQNDKIRFYSADISSLFTQTATSAITARPTFDLGSAFTPQIQATISVDRGSDISATATVSALVGVIKQYERHYNLGVRAGNASPRQLLANIPNNQLNIRTGGFTAAIWAKRETVGNYLQTLWMPNNPFGERYNKVALIFDNNNIRLRSIYDGDEPGATWNNIAPMDSNWHQYTIWAKPNGNLQSVEWYLWIDGVNKGAESYYATMNGSEFTNGQYALFGHGLTPQDPQYDESKTPNSDVSTAQFWAGIINTTVAQFPIGEFYGNGYRDLGTTGRGTQQILPTPHIYNELNYGTSTIGNGSSTPLSAASEPLQIVEPLAIFTVTAQPETVIVTTSNIEAVVTLAADVGYRVSGRADLESAHTLSLSRIDRLRLATAALDSEFAQTTQESRYRHFDSDIAAEFDLATDIIRVIPNAAALTAASTLTATADDRTRDISAEFAVTSTVTARIDDRTRDAIVLEFGEFTLDCDPYVILPFGATITATATAFCDPTIVTEVALELSTNFTIPPIVVYRVLIMAAVMEVTGFQIAVGDVINFDPCREIRVKPESRQARIRSENRLLEVDEETRTLRTPQETRLLRLETETRVNILECQG